MTVRLVTPSEDDLEHGKRQLALATTPTSARLIQLARDWRAGRVTNIGPGMTALYYEVLALEAELNEHKERT